MENRKECLGTLMRPSLFHPFCECLGTFSNFNIFFFILFYFILLSKNQREEVLDAKNEKMER